MIETKVPVDIRKYKTKLIGPFTTRQLICVSIAAIIDVLFAYISSLFGGINVRVMIYVLIFIDLPILAFMFEVSGMPMEIYLRKVLLKTFLSPAKRKATNPTLDKAIKPQKTLTKQETKTKKKEAKKQAKKLKKAIKYEKKYIAYQ